MTARCRPVGLRILQASPRLRRRLAWCPTAAALAAAVALGVVVAPKSTPSSVEPTGLRRRHFDGWTLNYSFRDEANLDLLLEPRAGIRRGPLAVNVEVLRRRGRWLVDAAVPSAVFSPPGAPPRILAQPDLTPGGSSAVADRSRLSPVWLLAPTALLVLPLAALAVAAARAASRRPRATRAGR